MFEIGTASQPLRVAIIGSGPSGFYAADHLLRQKDLTVEIDMFDKLPTPFGLVRGGVAPDHQKIKSVTKLYDRIASHDRFKFYGNVKFGDTITYDDISRHYHAVIYAVGAQTDRNLNVPGEDLPGSYAATQFVGWYNGHPDYCDYQFDLSQSSVAVVGVGNVAMDVARILGRSVAELQETDIADYALEALQNSNIRDIHIFGRRGPAQAAFTNPEIKELGEMEEVDLIIDPDELILDEYSQAYLNSPDADKKDIRNLEIMQEYAARPPQGRPKRIHLHFLTSPVLISGEGCVESLTMVKNALYQDEKGNIRPQATDQQRTFSVGLIFRSVGYYGVALPDVPFDEKRGTIPNVQGRVLVEAGAEEIRTGNYVVGWIKRGPSGVIGTNKPDSVESAEQLLADVTAGELLQPSNPSREAIDQLLDERGVTVVTYADWQRLDQIEQEQGQQLGRPRLKFSRVEDMLAALQSS